MTSPCCGGRGHNSAGRWGRQDVGADGGWKAAGNLKPSRLQTAGPGGGLPTSFSRPHCFMGHGQPTWSLWPGVQQVIRARRPLCLGSLLMLGVREAWGGADGQSGHRTSGLSIRLTHAMISQLSQVNQWILSIFLFAGKEEALRTSQRNRARASPEPAGPTVASSLLGTLSKCSLWAAPYPPSAATPTLTCSSRSPRQLTPLSQR